MLSLDSDRWSELQHAYGDASNIPALLVQLIDLPSATGDAEPWFSLWSALAHQGKCLMHRLLRSRMSFRL